MGQNLSNAQSFEKLFDNLTSRSLHVNLCFIIESNSFQDYIEEFISKFEQKYPNNSHKYSLIVSVNYPIKYVDFELGDNFKRKIEDEQNYLNAMYTDVFECAYFKLKWRNSIKLILRINDSPNDRSTIDYSADYSQRLIDNYDVSIFTLSTNEFETLIKYMETLKSNDLITSNKSSDKSDNITRLNVITSKDEQPKVFKNITEYTYSFAYVHEAGTCERVLILTSEQTNYEIHIEKKPFQEGNEMYCFKGKLFDGANEHKKVFKLAKFKNINVLHNHKAQVIAGDLADSFTKEFHKSLSIKYTKTSVVQLGEERYLMDDFIDGFYTKFTSNGLLLNATKDWKLIEFSHWTYKFTNCDRLVTDLQGCKVSENEFILSDPAIHSVNRIFGATDLSTDGIYRFLAFHSCRLNELDFENQSKQASSTHFDSKLKPQDENFDKSSSQTNKNQFASQNCARQSKSEEKISSESSYRDLNNYHMIQKNSNLTNSSVGSTYDIDFNKQSNQKSSIELGSKKTLEINVDAVCRSKNHKSPHYDYNHDQITQINSSYINKTYELPMNQHESNSEIKSVDRLNSLINKCETWAQKLTRQQQMDVQEVNSEHRPISQLNRRESTIQSFSNQNKNDQHHNQSNLIPVTASSNNMNAIVNLQPTSTNLNSGKLLPTYNEYQDRVTTASYHHNSRQLSNQTQHSSQPKSSSADTRSSSKSYSSSKNYAKKQTYQKKRC